VTKAPSGAPASPRPAPQPGFPERTAGPRSAGASQAAPEERPGIARVIAIANQKGGVGKSTTAVSLGAALADLGYRVLVVDLDPQGNASTGLGIRHQARATTVYDVVVGEAPLSGAVVETQVMGLHAIPSTIDLAGAEIELVSQFSRESRLKKALESVREGVYDFVLLDCPPSLGLLTVNALTAAEELIVPIQCEYYALEGLGQLLRNVSLVQQNINPDLRLTGIVMTMFDPRTKLSEQVVDEVRRFFGDLVYNVIIPRTVRLSEAPGFGQPITVYDPRSKGAETYRDLAKEVALRPPLESPMPSYDQLPSIAMAVREDVAPPRPQEEERTDTGTVPEPPSEPAIETERSHTSVSEPLDGETNDERVAASDPVSMAQAVPSEPSVPQAEVPEAPPSPTEADVWEEDPDEGQPPTPTPSARRLVVIDDDRDIDIRAGREPPVERSPHASEQQDAITPIGATLEAEQGGRRRRWRLFRKGGE
jgi:chromosome partitioning protein